MSNKRGRLIFVPFKCDPTLLAMRADRFCTVWSMRFRATIYLLTGTIDTFL